MTLVTFCRLSCLTAVGAVTLLAVPVHTSPRARITTAPLVPSSAAPAVEPLFAQTGAVTESPDNPHVIRRATTIVSEKAITSGAVLTCPPVWCAHETAELNGVKTPLGCRDART